MFFNHTFRAISCRLLEFVIPVCLISVPFEFCIFPPSMEAEIHSGGGVSHYTPTICGGSNVQGEGEALDLKMLLPSKRLV